MKDALEKEDLHPFLITQPLAYHTPDANRQGFIDLPEFPFGKIFFPISGTIETLTPRIFFESIGVSFRRSLCRIFGIAVA